MNILVVEDLKEKAKRIIDAVRAAGPADRVTVIECEDAMSAKRALSVESFDLLLLDVIIPKRPGVSPAAAVGAELLDDICQDATLKKPRYIVGITADDGAFADAHRLFERNLWTLLRYSKSTSDWEEAIHTIVRYIAGDGVEGGVAIPILSCDVAVVTAVPGVEFAAIKALPVNWSVRRVAGDATEYFTTKCWVDGRALQVVAATATQMGMTSMAVLCAKVISLFRPRFLVLCGIAAGYKDCCQLGDVLICDQTWDCGSGKIIKEGEFSRFLPEPRVINLHGQLREMLVNHANERRFVGEICAGWKGARPNGDLRSVVGSVVTGAAVIADPGEALRYRETHRKIVGLDMETYAAFYAAHHGFQPAPQPLSIKSVCDFADEKKGDEFQPYAAYTSASYFLALLRTGFFARTP